MRSWIQRAVPPQLFVSGWHVGDQSGKDKNASFMVFHWGELDILPSVGQERKLAEHRRDHLVLFVTGVGARKCAISSTSVCSVSRHALMRLFYRLKTTDERVVLAELADIGQVFLRYKDVIDTMGWDCELLVPSKSGAFVLVRDRDFAGHRIVSTWLSDARMVDDGTRHAAVAMARQEGGVVVNNVGGFPIVSRARLEKGGARGMVSAVELNRLCDQSFGASGRLPEGWRFISSEAALVLPARSKGDA